jgi:ABC-2 type transport system ATP-binding protein
VSAAALQNAGKRFGEIAALDGVSFAVEQGEVVALLGPNGAGKSTALGLLLGLRRPDSGAAWLFGANPRRSAARRSVGVAPQETLLPATLRVGELLEFVRAHFPKPPPTRAILERFELAALARRQLGGLSGGERRRVAVALAFAGDPCLVVLDEPTAGLDLPSRRSVWQAIREHAARGGTILLTTHYLEEADALAQRIILVEAGRVVAAGATGEIKAAAGLTAVSFRPPPRTVIAGAELAGDRVRILTHDGGQAVARLLREGIPLVDLEVRPLTLEEALASRRTAG